jgi:hypothetical protein
MRTAAASMPSVGYLLLQFRQSLRFQHSKPYLCINPPDGERRRDRVDFPDQPPSAGKSPSKSPALRLIDLANFQQFALLVPYKSQCMPRISLDRCVRSLFQGRPRKSLKLGCLGHFCCGHYSKFCQNNLTFITVLIDMKVTDRTLRSFVIESFLNVDGHPYGHRY